MKPSVFAGDEALWLHCYQQLQDDAIRASLGAWIDATSPRFGPAIASRFARLEGLDDAKSRDAANCAQRSHGHIDASWSATA